jgi:hemoglobin/transferrin/lactoferrin receptor protein
LCLTSDVPGQDSARHTLAGFYLVCPPNRLSAVKRTPIELSTSAHRSTASTNADLKPETSETFEGGVRLTSEAISLSVTGFTGSYRNFISLENVGFGSDGFMLFQNINLGKVKISGAEAQFEARSRNGLHANLAMSYAKGTINPDGTNEAGLLSIDPAKLVMGLGYRDPGGRFGGQLIMTHSAGKSVGSVRGNGEPESREQPNLKAVYEFTA